MDGLILFENGDVEVLEKLIHSNLLLLNHSNHNKMTGVYHENEKVQMKEYLKLFTGGKAKIYYNRTKGIPYGRSNPSRGSFSYPSRNSSYVSREYERFDIAL